MIQQKKNKHTEPWERNLRHYQDESKKAIELKMKY